MDTLELNGHSEGVDAAAATAVIGGENAAENVGAVGDGAAPAAAKPVQDYSEMFPALPLNEGKPAKAAQTAVWNAAAVRSSVVTSVFQVPVAEQKLKDLAGENQFGDKRDKKFCDDIMRQTGAKIEISKSRDKELTVVITGKKDAVISAKSQVLRKLQHQATEEVIIPTEHHRFIIGKGGENLRRLQEETCTQIYLPKAEEKSSVVRIIGTAENIRQAHAALQKISDEKSKLDQVRLEVLKAYHPLICGYKNETVNQIAEDNGVKIHVPPPLVDHNEIVVSGEKNAVANAVASLRSIYEEKKRTCAELTANVPRSQHKYVIGRKGCNIQEILQRTGVVVEVPQQSTDSEEIILRGAQQHLGTALTLVYEKANSMCTMSLDVPGWIQYHLKGRSGANISTFNGDMPKVHIDFQVDNNVVEVEGPPEQAKLVHAALAKEAQRLSSTFAHDEIKVDPKHHRHLIGRGGSNISKIKNESGAEIHIPNSESTNKPDIIRIEGVPDAVTKAKQMLKDAVSQLENSRSVDVIIPQRLHRQIIGSGGSSIREIITKYNGISINFPDSKKDSDIITLRGDKKDVEACEDHLKKLHKRLEEENFSIEVPIFKEFHKNIVGKGGSTINQIKTETDTKIIMPKEGSGSNCVTIIGKEKNCEAAKEKILEIQSKMANIVSEKVPVAKKLHAVIIGAKGKVVNSIMKQFGVQIHFPNSKSTDTDVEVRGPKEDVAAAKEEILKMATEQALNHKTVEIRVPHDKHRHIIGRGGVAMKKLQDEHNVRLIFPSSDASGEGADSISIVGSDKAINAAKDKILARVTELDNIVEDNVEVDPRHFPSFMARRAHFLQEIADEFGGVRVNLPPRSATGDAAKLVHLKGGKEDVPAAIEKIKQFVDDLEARVTKYVTIERQYFAALLGRQGRNLQQVEQDFKVSVKLPMRKRPAKKAAAPKAAEAVEEKPVETSAENGDAPAAATEEPAAAADEEKVEASEPAKPVDPHADDIAVSGRPEQCDAAIEALKALVPASEIVEVPAELHRFVIGQKGTGIREMVAEAPDAEFKFPKGSDKNDQVTVLALPKDMDAAKAALANRVKVAEEMKRKTYREEVEIDHKHHKMILGQRGAAINEFRKIHDVRIDLPRQGDKNQDIIVFTGYPEDVEAAKEAMLEKVAAWDAWEEQTVEIEPKIHPRIIGQRGSGIKALQEQYNVQITFKKDSPIVTVVGELEDVEDAIEDLLFQRDDFLEDVADEQYLRPPSKETNAPKPKQSPLKYNNAPWDNKKEEQSFPTLGGGNSNGTSSATAWNRKPAV